MCIRNICCHFVAVETIYASTKSNEVRRELHVLLRVLNGLMTQIVRD